MDTAMEKMRPIWVDKESGVVKIIDQRRLPHEFVVADLRCVDDVIRAIKEMCVRGAPLIGVTGAYGVYLAVLNASGSPDENNDISAACQKIIAARPTAINLTWAVS